MLVDRQRDNRQKNRNQILNMNVWCGFFFDPSMILTQYIYDCICCLDKTRPCQSAFGLWEHVMVILLIFYKPNNESNH